MPHHALGSMPLFTTPFNHKHWFMTSLKSIFFIIIMDIFKYFLFLARKVINEFRAVLTVFLIGSFSKKTSFHGQLFLN